jgi:hypothetical protein
MKSRVGFACLMAHSDQENTKVQHLIDRAGFADIVASNDRSVLKLISANKEMRGSGKFRVFRSKLMVSNRCLYAEKMA